MHTTSTTPLCAFAICAALLLGALACDDPQTPDVNIDLDMGRVEPDPVDPQPDLGVDDPQPDPVDDPVDPEPDPVDDPVDDPIDDPVDDPQPDPVDDPIEDPQPDPEPDPIDDPIDDPQPEPEDVVPDLVDDPVDPEPEPQPDPEPVAGLDERPENPSCLAPQRPPVGDVDINLEQVFAGLSFTFPLAMEKAPGEPGAWYMMEKSGRILRFEDRPNVTETELVLDIEARVVVNIDNANDERGLLGMAFHPDFANNGEIYLSYTGLVVGRTWSRVSRFTREDNGHAIDPNSEEILFEFFQPANNHNGGDLKFGPDGFLYLSFGDGGGGGDPFNNGQDTSNFFATILRLDVDQRRGEDPPYGIPADNPFVGGGGVPEIYAWGLRNVWRFSFDMETGELWAADVGQSRREEVDLIELGGNYGWPVREGDECYNNNPLCGEDESFIEPVAVYNRAQGRSITGGYVYRGDEIPQLIGTYLYADFVTGRLFGIFFDENGDADPQVIADTPLFISAFAQDNEGEVFLLSYRDGRVFKIGPDETPPPPDFPARLSLTGCVDPDNPSEPLPALIPYDINVPFWSDGAEKRRWFAIPEGTTIEVDESGDFLFPVGTVTMKDFSLDGRLIETRLFVRHEDGTWGGYSYAWDEAQTDAFLLPAGQTAQVGDQTWHFPNRPQCVVCHTEAAGRTLGPEVRQLNGDLTYPRTGRTANQLRTLEAIGVLAPLGAEPELLDALPQPDDRGAGTEAHARAYLHTNCSSCHRPGSTARGDLDFTFDAETLAQRVCNTAPEFGTLGIVDARIVAEGDVDRSVLFERVGRRDVTGMPPLASDLIDEAGLDVLRAWIESDFCEGIEPPESQCGDNVDNDEDGDTDCDDEDCAEALACEPLTCGNPEAISGLPATRTGSTLNRPNQHAGNCSQNSGTEAVYAFVPSEAGTVCIDTLGSNYDTFLHVRTDCTDPVTEVACNDDIGQILQSEVEVEVEAEAAYFIFVDGFDGGGSYTLNLSEGPCQ